MNNPLTFQPIDRMVKLPENYMPAGLSALRGEPGAQGRVLFEMRTWEEEIDFAAVTAHQIGDLAFWDASLGQAARAEAIFCLGQPLDAPAARSACRLAPSAADIPLAGHEGRSAVVIIDHGIAFWNDRFRLGTAPGAPSRFQEVQFLSFEDPGADEYQITVLTKAQIDGFCAQADAPGGQAKVIQTLGAMIPGCFYGSAANPQGLWHGTAMADLAAGAARDAPDDRMLFGLELPTAALRDWGGDTLQTLLMTALSAALRMVAPVLEPGSTFRELVIVLAFGFPAGPQDGSHPAADLIRSFLAVMNARLGRKGFAVRLVLPAGNHLQDQCHARLPAQDASGVPSVTWRVAPDDYSPNTVEICVQTRSDPGLEVVAPDGSSAQVTLQAGGFAPLIREGVMIGGVHRLPDRGGWAKLRLTLAATVWRHPGPQPAPFGDWTLRVAADAEAELWILRDDRDVVADATTPHRPSVFVDPAYLREDAQGAPVIDDSGGGFVRRAGTASVLTTARHADAVAVAASVANPSGGTMNASYSSLPRSSATGFAASVQIGDAGFREGVICAGNGSAQEFRILGTSAAAALHGRALAGLG